MAGGTSPARPGKNAGGTGREIREPKDVVQRGLERGQGGVVQHAGLELERRLVLGGLDPVGEEPLEELSLPPEDPEHGPKTLYPEKTREIAAHLGDVDRAVGGVMDGVDRDEAAGDLWRGRAG
jgi:hypothetical protein